MRRPQSRGTRRRPPEVRPTAFATRPPDLPPRPLMAVDFAIIGSLVRPGRPRYPVLVHRAATLLHAFFRPHLAMMPLRFANPSPPSGWIEDFHLQAVVQYSAHQKKALGQPGLARIDHERKSRDHGALDVPILSQSMNQARRGSRKRPDPPLDTTGPGGGYSKRLRMLEHQLAGWAVCARALRECLIGGKASVVSSLPLLLSEHIGSGL